MARITGSHGELVKPLLVVAVASLRSYWASAVVIVALGAAGLATLTPIRSLASRTPDAETLLRLPPIPAAGAPVAASPESIEPSAFQARALGELYTLLLILGWAALVIAGISILTRFSSQTATRGPEVGVHRASGASRRDLVLALLGEGGMLFLGVLALGLPVSILLLNVFVSDWPGIVTGASLIPWAATVVLFVTLSVGAITPLRFAVTRSIKDDADGQVRLGVPMFQLALSLAMLMGSAVLLQRGRGVEREAAGPSDGSAQVYRLTSHTAEPATRSRELGAMLDSLQSAPGIAAVSLASPGTAVGLGRWITPPLIAGSVCWGRSRCATGWSRHAITWSANKRWRCRVFGCWQAGHSRRKTGGMPLG